MLRRMEQKPIVVGQPVTEAKALLARYLRQNMTAAERVLWQHLRANRLDNYHFRRQQVIGGFVVDFYCHRARLAIEVDGAGHDDLYDGERDSILAEFGVRVLRFSNEDVLKSLDAVLAQIREELARGTET